MNVMAGKSISWRKDPAILERMERVADLDIRRWSMRRIGLEVGISPACVMVDLERIRTLRREAITQGDVEDKRQAAIAVYRLEQAEAWARLAALPPEARNAPEYIAAVNAAQKEIDRLEGTAMPTKVAATDPTGEHASEPHTELLGRIAELAARAGAYSDYSEPAGD